VLITDELFDAYLRCKTKAHLTFRQAMPTEASHLISDWIRRLADNYQAECRNRLQLSESADCFVGSPSSEDLRSAKYRLIVQPHLTAQDVVSNVHALERGPAPTQKSHNPYAPVRFVPLEKISKHHKLMLAFDAFVLWQASGQMPTKGIIIHGLQHTVLRLKLDSWIREVESLVGKLRSSLTEGTPAEPVLIKHCPECIFEACCRKRVTEKDDLSLLDGLGTTDRAKLNAKGIFTVTQLAYTFRPRRRAPYPKPRQDRGAACEPPQSCMFIALWHPLRRLAHPWLESR
jgi:predicted RecB family nuclease